MTIVVNIFITIFHTERPFLVSPIFLLKCNGLEHILFILISNNLEVLHSLSQSSTATFNGEEYH